MKMKIEMEMEMVREIDMDMEMATVIKREMHMEMDMEMDTDMARDCDDDPNAQETKRRRSDFDHCLDFCSWWACSLFVVSLFCQANFTSPRPLQPLAKDCATPTCPSCP